MTKAIKTERRWLRSVIVASAEPQPALPWMRGQRKRPSAMGGEGVTPAKDALQIGFLHRTGAIAAR